MPRKMTDDELNDAATLRSLRRLKTTTPLPRLECVHWSDPGERFCTRCGVRKVAS